MWDSSDDENIPRTVVDNGSHTIRSGLSDGKTCTFRMQTIIGRLRNDNNKLIGDNAIRQQEDYLNITCPIQHGIISNWEDMISIWDFMFTSRLSLQKRGVLITEPPLNPKSNREKMSQVLFEFFNIPELYVSMPAMLALYNQGKNTGVVLDVGESITHIAPFYDGYLIRDGVRRIDFGGKDLNLYLQKLMFKQGYSFTTFAELENLRKMKESVCCVSLDSHKANFLSEFDESKQKSFTLSNGDNVLLDKYTMFCGEALFDPSLTGANFPGVHHLLFDSIMSCDVNIRRDLFVNIILSGASTLFPGFQARVQNEMLSLIPPKNLLMVQAPPERNKSAWLGGAIMTSLSAFDKCWVSKSQYEEYGPSIMHRCC